MLPNGAETVYELADDEAAYIVPATGSIEINGEELPPRDGAAIRGERFLRIKALDDAEVVLLVVTG
jgi:redox-sensitive bicupin YhaK (pirin superfamily)